MYLYANQPIVGRKAAKLYGFSVQNAQMLIELAKKVVMSGFDVFVRLAGGSCSRFGQYMT
jgi:hypothetical protein